MKFGIWFGLKSGLHKPSTLHKQDKKNYAAGRQMAMSEKRKGLIIQTPWCGATVVAILRCQCVRQGAGRNNITRQFCGGIIYLGNSIIIDNSTMLSHTLFD